MSSKILNTFENISIEIRMIQLQLYLAKKSVNKISLRNIPIKAELHINHALESLNHLIIHIDDFKTKDLKTA